MSYHVNIRTLDYDFNLQTSVGDTPKFKAHDKRCQVGVYVPYGFSNICVE